MDVFQLIGYPLLFVTVLEVLLGTVLLNNNPRKSRVNKSAAILSLVSAGYSFFTALMYVRTSQGMPIDLVARASWIGWFAPTAALQTIYYMKRENNRAARNAGLVLYPFWSIILVLCLFTDLLEPSGYSLRPYVDHTGLLENPIRMFGALQALWVLREFYRIRKQSTGIQRVQMNYFFAGLVIFGMGGAFFGGFLQLYAGFGIVAGLGAYFSLPWILLTFYAITRYRLFDIRLAISRTVTVITLSAVFIGIDLVLFHLFVPVLGYNLAILISLSVISMLFFGTSFNRSMQERIKGIVIGHRYDYQELLKDSIHAMLKILDRDDLLHHIVGGMKKSLEVENVRLFLIERDGSLVCRDVSGDQGRAENVCATKADVANWIRRSGHAFLRGELEEQLSEPGAHAVYDCMQKIDAELLVPLINKGQLQGFLTLGARGTGAPYLQSDIDLLETLAGQAAIAIENALLYDEARHSRESLRESELKFRTLAETTPSAIFIHRGDAFLYVNPNTERISGYAQEELLTMDFWGIVHPDSQRIVQEQGRALLYSDAVPFQHEFKIIRKDHEERWVLMNATRFEYEGRISVIGTLIDITERKALEGKLRYAQKMEAMGKLAGGVAHDFNNVLTAIVGYGHILRMKIGRDDPLRDHVDQILSATERAAHMTQSLLAFGKKQVTSVAPGDLNDIVKRMEKLLSGLLREGVAFSLSTAPGRLPVQVDKSQIERVIMNLLVNARDAMPDGGTVTIKTGSEKLDSEFISTHGFGKPGLYAAVSVSDTGIGMDASTRAKIFEPFFTTKGLEKGTGLGLSIVYDIVKEHAGYITVASEQGKGSMFKVYLPWDTAIAEEMRPVSIPDAQASGTILVAVNADEIRELLKAILMGSGYTVITASDGKVALEQFMKHKDSIHLVILDVIMPGMNGNDAYKAIRLQQPGIKALFTSGYTELVVQEKGLLEQGQYFMSEPYSPKEVMARVREVLNNPSERTSH
jgi:PAS domain S-box-containing protein